MRAGDILKQRLFWSAAVLCVISSMMGYALWMGDLHIARLYFSAQLLILIGAPWSTYREVRRAWRNEPPDDKDFTGPWRILLGLWLAAIVLLGLLQ